MKIAIDLDCIGLLKNVKTEIENQFWWGPKFNDDLTQITTGVTVYSNEKYSALLSEFKSTEFRWYEQDGKHTFECEELTDIPNMRGEGEDLYGCRFVHSMVDSTNNMPIHLDGAIRAYTDLKMICREDTHLDSTARDTIYTKIWRVDNAISVDKWKELITHFYRDNFMIGEYFGAVPPFKVDDEIEDKKEATLKDFVPDNLTIDSGIKMFISAHKNSINQRNCDVYISPTSANCIGPVFESIVVTFNKMIKSMSYKTGMPDAQIFEYADLVTNIPNLICKDLKVANDIMSLIQELVDYWIQKGEDRLLSFSLSIPYVTKSLTVSYAGHIQCFDKYFHATHFKKFPTNESEITQWIIHHYKTITTLFNDTNLDNPLTLVKENNIIVLDRKMIKSDCLQIEENENCFYRNKALQPDIVEALQREKIEVALASTDEKLICSKCRSDYNECNCILYRDKDVICEVQDFKPIGYFWTNRKA